MRSTDARARPSLGGSHPLLGADPATLVRVLARNGWPRERGALAAAALASGLARAPLSALERLWVRLHRRRARDMRPPVFIIGHWRSGTTHLYNLLSRDPAFGFVTPLATGMPWNFLLLGQWLRPLLERALPENRFVDRVEVRPDSPQEDEIALASMQAVSFYHGLYFPRHLEEEFRRGVFFDGCSQAQIDRWRRQLIHFVTKLAVAQPGKQLLIKNPVYTARVRMLAEMFPGARFIHIVRNPYVVFESTRTFYRRLVSQLALESSDLDAVDELILDSYPRMLRAAERDAAKLPPGRFSETRFEVFERAPVEEAERLYRELDLGGFERARPHFEAYLRRVAGYRKNVHPFPGADMDQVAVRWRPFIDRWGYHPPGYGPASKGGATPK